MPTTRLSELWLEKKLFDGQASLRVGQLGLRAVQRHLEVPRVQRHEHLAGLGERHHRRGGAAALGVGDDDGVARLEDGDDGVGGTEVDTDGLGHDVLLGG